MDTTPSSGTLASTHPQVRDRVAEHLRSVDAAIPGLIELLYLTGSVALGDYQPGTSDIDFVAVTSRPLKADDLSILAGLHTGFPSPPHYDGLYLDRAALAGRPDNEETVPHITGGVFSADRPCGELNPVLWLTLTRYGVAVRGPHPEELAVRVDPERLRDWNLANLKTYWQPHADRIRHVAEEQGPDAVPPADLVTWTVLGPARLHYTLATGDVASKSRAADYATEQFPTWAALTARARSQRAGSRVTFSMADAVAATAMVDFIVADAWRRWGAPVRPAPMG